MNVIEDFRVRKIEILIGREMNAISKIDSPDSNHGSSLSRDYPETICRAALYIRIERLRFTFGLSYHRCCVSYRFFGAGIEA